jgi:hypothetical protein
MVEGICENKSLKELVFEECEISLHVLIALVESLSVNQTIVSFRVDGCTIGGSDDEKQTFCQTLSHVFRVNRSLESFCLPHMEISGENGLMKILLGGLVYNKRIKTIDFSR